MNNAKSIPYKEICDAVFKTEILPATYRWISSLSPEQLQRFGDVFPCLAKDGGDGTITRTHHAENKLQSSRYTMPEWQAFSVSKPVQVDEKSVESLLARATSSNLAYGAFDEGQMRACRAVPARTRDSDKSQINSTERSESYMTRWSSRMMNSSYRADICHTGYKRTVKDVTPDQTVTVYSKATLNEAASERAKNFIDKDPLWTRTFRELCRNLSESIDGTCYRNSFTTIKKATGERCVHPRWSDPLPATTGTKKSPESLWQTSMRGHFAAPTRTEETFKVADQHHACYKRPFDLYPMTDKVTSSFRDDFVDHVKNKDDQPEYWTDMRVKMPAGSGVVGSVIGTQ